MPATFGVTSIPSGFTVPTGCVIQKIGDKESLENSEMKSPLGVTVRNIPHKLISREVSIEMVGIAPLSLCTAGAFTLGTLKVIKVRNDEGNDKVPQSTVTMKAYSNTEEEE